MNKHSFVQFRYSLERKVVDLYATVTFATGVATVTRGKGITSITRTGSAGSGAYDVVFDSKYKALLSFDCAFKDDTSAANNVPLTRFCYIAAEDVAAGTMSLQFTILANTANDPADATTVYLHWALADTDAY